MNWNQTFFINVAESKIQKLPFALQTLVFLITNVLKMHFLHCILISNFITIWKFSNKMCSHISIAEIKLKTNLLTVIVFFRF